MVIYPCYLLSSVRIVSRDRVLIVLDVCPICARNYVREQFDNEAFEFTSPEASRLFNDAMKVVEEKFG